jgi:hypothetical protein
MDAEGWYVDPYGVHEVRWFSDGSATALVRDGVVEAHDPPPDAPYEGPLVEPPETVVDDGSDLRRADAGTPPPDLEDMWVAFDETSGAD